MKKILITGATDGIGLATAKSLAALGHELMLHGRSSDKLTKTFESLAASNPNLKLTGYLADLSDLSQVNKLTKEIKKNHQNIDVIINNAGVFKTPNPILDNGLDSRFMVNTISPYLITKELMPILVDDGRVVNLSSAAQAPVNLKALSGEASINDDFEAYAQSKLALTICSQEMAKDLKPNQVVVAVNPGSLLASKMVKEGFGVAGNDLSIGSNILVSASLSAEFLNKSGQYFDNDSKQFTNPHVEAQDLTKCVAVLRAVELVIERAA
jgi:NAD(P)-dependent dehydrogenase (short-subunit alcohol dehydrogenase family)